MKNKLYGVLFLIIAATIIFACTKEDKLEKIKSSITNSNVIIIDTDAEIQMRNGVDIISFLTSGTEDNFLLGNTNRTQKVYNQSLIERIDLKQGTLGTAIFQGNKLRHYVKITYFTDGSADSIPTYALDRGVEYTFVSSAQNNILSNSNSKSVKIVRITGSKDYINFYNNMKTKLWLWEIYKETDLLGVEFLAPTSKNTNQFQFNHIL